MTIRLWMLAHGSTPAQRAGRFPGGEGLDPAQVPALIALRHILPGVDTVLCAPDPAAQETARVLGLPATSEPDLAEIAYGDWQGRTLDAVFQTAPEQADRWRNDPDAAPHGGDSFAAVARRTASWLDRLQSAQRRASHRLLAIAPVTVLRLTLTTVLGAPVASLWSLDIRPLTLLEFSHDGRRWAYRPAALAAGPENPPGQD